jgi:hypothetical protein
LELRREAGYGDGFGSNPMNVVSEIMDEGKVMIGLSLQLSDFLPERT